MNFDWSIDLSAPKNLHNFQICQMGTILELPIDRYRFMFNRVFPVPFSNHPVYVDRYAVPSIHIERISLSVYYM